MPAIHRRLRRTLNRARFARIRDRLEVLADLGVDILHMEDGEFKQLCKGIDEWIARRSKRRGREYGGLRGEERQERIRELLVQECKLLGYRSLPFGGNSTWWRGGRFPYVKAWKFLATQKLPKDLRRLFKRARISWRTFRYHTRDALYGWHMDRAREELNAEIAATSGLLRHNEQ